MSDLPPVRFLDRTTPPHIATLILLAGISALSQSIFLPSLAHMTDWFGTDYAVMQLSVSGYLAATALMQLAIGPLSDRFGRRPVMLWGMGLFVLATLGTLLAPDIVTFLACRLAQAVVATGLVLGRAAVRDMVPGEEAASRIGYVTMGMALVPMLGPMIGGALDAGFGWQGGFWFLLLAGIAVLALAWLDQGETLRPGAAQAAARGGTGDLLRSPRFWGYTCCTMFASGAFFALLGGASFVANDVFGLTPLWAGIALGAPAVGYAAGNFLSGRYSRRLGIDRMVLAGSGVGVAGLGASLLLSLLGLDDAWVFFGFCTFLGLGNGLIMPNATAGLLSVRPHLAGTASGLGGAVMIGGGALLSALTGLVLRPETGALPLQAIMLAALTLSGVSILLVMRRARHLGL